MTKKKTWLTDKKCKWCHAYITTMGFCECAGMAGDNPVIERE